MRLRASLTAGFAALACAAPAQAASWTVTDGSSDATTACDQSAHTCASLRAAIAAAEATKEEADTITVPAGTIQVADDLAIASDMTIAGVSARRNIIDGGGKYRGFRIAAGATVRIEHFTIRNGAAGQGGSSDGGGVLNQGATTLSDVRVTGGRATRGGGIANLAGGVLQLQRVLVDGNTATSDGGGIASIGGAEVTPVTGVALADSTVYANTAGIGGAGGIASRAMGLLVVERATIADNAGGARGTGGIAVAATERARVSGSIVARNRIATAAANCGAPVPGDSGANVSDDATCGFSLVADPRLAATPADAGGDVDVLAIAASSPAVDRVPAGTLCPAATLDQRRLPRPQGSACDAGAFEVDRTPPPAPVIASGPSGVTADPSPVFTFTAAEADRVECRLDGPGGRTGTFAACTSPRGFSALAPGDYVFSVRATDAAGNAITTERRFTVAAPQAATPVPTIAPTQTPTPGPAPVATIAPTQTPVPDESVEALPVSGTVLVRLPGSRRFVPLSPSLIRNGAEVDARKGEVEIRRADGGTARFSGGIFKLGHAGGLTTLTLTEKLTGCPKPKRGKRASATTAGGAAAAAAAAKKVKTRKLWGDGKGKFRVRGKYSSATVRGTRWLVQDTCTATFTRVTTGAVTVQDFVKRKRVVVRKGKPYTARPKKR